MTYAEIQKNEEIIAFIKKADANLGVLGYTNHAIGHCTIVAEHAAMILEALGHSEHEIELVKIAAYMHDIGNAINRSCHGEYGALLANDILRRTDMPLDDRVQIVSAIALHDENTGGAVDAVSAALIIGDKTDVRRSRVRNRNIATFDIHDRVNYAVTKAELNIDAADKTITLALEVDDEICSMYEYFEIFLGRMLMCRRSAELLGTKFRLTANGSKIL